MLRAVASSTRVRLWVVVTCMGRLAFLRRTLPTVLAHVNCGYCLVDYSCPDASSEWLRAHHAPELESGRLTIASVAGKAHFHKPEALNAGARHVIERGAEQLCFLDADTLARPGLGRFLHESSYPERFLVALEGRSLFGFLALPAAAFLRVGGFDESIVGYGAEDVEMRLRLHLVAGLGYMAVPRHLLRGMPHADELRTQHHVEKSRELSNQRNLEYVRRRVREWTGQDVFELGPSVLRLYGSPRDERR